MVTGPAGWSFGVESDEGQDGTQLSTSPERVTLLVPPGDVQVRCSEAMETAPGASTAPDAPAALRIEDPEALYRPMTPGGTGSCVTGAPDYVDGAQGIEGDPISITRAAVHGLTTGDVVERGGYPSETGFVRIVQGGKVIGSVSFERTTGGGWRVSTFTMCEGLRFEWPRTSPG